MALLVIAIPLLAIWPFGIASNLYDEKRLLVVTLLAAITLLAATVRSMRLMWQARLESLPSAASRILVVLLLLGVLSSWHAALPVAALTELALWVMLFTLLTIVADLRAWLQQHFDLVMTGMLALILFIYLLVTSGYFLQALTGMRELDIRRLLVNFSNLRHFNQFQSWTLPLVVLPVLYAQRRGWRMSQWLFLLAAANWWLLLFLSGGRGVPAAMIGSTLLMVLVFRRSVSQWLKWQGLALLGGVTLFLLASQLTADLFEDVVETMGVESGWLSGRDQLWGMALTLIKENPLLGVGPMHYACSDPVLAGHPHNAPLQIAAEWGLPALLLLSVLVLWTLYRAIQSTRRHQVDTTEMDIAPLLLASILTAAIHAQVCGIIVTPISQLMLAVIGGWLWGVLTPVADGAGRWCAANLIGGVAMAASLVLLTSIVAPLWRDAINGTVPESDQARNYMPRFWLDGAICQSESPWRNHREK